MRAVRLKYATTLNMGQSPDSTEVEILLEGQPFIQGNAEFGELFPVPDKQCDTAPKSAQKNDILVSVRAPVGAVNIADKKLGIGRGLCALSPKLATSKFAFYSLLNSKSDLLAESKGSTFGAITAEELGNIKIPLPRIEVQNEITDLLDRETAKIDRLIEEKERLLQLLDERRQALITQAVTRGLDPSVPMKDSGLPWLGEIPAHWNVCPIKSICTINDDVLDEKTDEDFEFRYIDIGSVNSRGQVLTAETLKFGSAPSRARRRLKIGDVIVSTVRTYLKAIAFIESEHSDSVASTGFAVLRANDGVAPKFLGSLVRTNYFVSEVFSRSVGVSYPAITSSELGSIKVPLPPREEQDQISDHVSRINNEVNSQEEVLKLTVSKLKDRRSSLIHEAVTGQVEAF